MQFFIFCAILMTSADVAWSRSVIESKNSQIDLCWTKVLNPRKIIATWEEAAQKCSTEGAILASPVTPELLQRMTSIITFNHHETPYFLGLKATSHLGPFVSVEGVALHNMPSDVTDMTDAIDPFLGDCLMMDHNSIRVTSCLARLPYMCYNNETLNGCEENVADYQINSETGSYYKLHTELKMWDEAHLTCVEEGGYLAVPNDAKEAQAIQHLYFGDNVSQSYSESDFLWIGIRDRLGNGTWISVNGEPVEILYKDWDSFAAPPVHDFKCAGFYRNVGAKISMRPCDYSKTFYHRAAFICEKNS